MRFLTNNTKCCLDDQIKESDMGKMCNVWGRRETHTQFGYRILKERFHLEYNIRTYLQETGWESVKWSHLA
jgi:hypothetical protein